jgi:hypothetical protein
LVEISLSVSLKHILLNKSRSLVMVRAPGKLFLAPKADVVKVNGYFYLLTLPGLHGIDFRHGVIVNFQLRSGVQEEPETSGW